MTEQKNIKKPEGGMIFFPREYFITDSINTSYAVGFNEKNEECVCFVIPKDENQAAQKEKNSSKTIPTLAEFSETSHRAKNPCFASKDNCLKNPCGILVMEQTERNTELEKDPKFNGLRVYVSKWASVIKDCCEGDNSFVPLGYGYIETSAYSIKSQELNDLLFEYKEVDKLLSLGQITSIDADEKKTFLYKQIMAGRTKKFTGVLLKNKKMFELTDFNIENIKDVFKKILEKLTKKGTYGAIILRVRKNGIVFKDLSAMCKMDYDYALKEVKPFDVVFDDFMKFNGNRIFKIAKQNNYSVDIIPAVRFNCGPKGNDKFSKEFLEPGTPKVLKTYIEKQAHNIPDINFVKNNLFLYAKIAIRLYEFGRSKKDFGSFLMSSAHAFSAPIGNVLTIDINGNSTYQLAFYFKNNQNLKAA